LAGQNTKKGLIRKREDRQKRKKVGVFPQMPLLKEEFTAG
jgi:hypothetical protein